MGNAPNKTQHGTVRLEDFLEGLDPARREQVDVLIAMMEDVSGEPPTMWGPSIIGFGEYHYKYESGREGNYCRLGFSPRKQQLVLYVVPGFSEYEGLLSRLGKHSTGKSCLYIKGLDGIDMVILRSICEQSWAWMARTYPA